MRRAWDVPHDIMDIRPSSVQYCGRATGINWTFVEPVFRESVDFAPSGLARDGGIDESARPAGLDSLPTSLLPNEFPDPVRVLDGDQQEAGNGSVGRHCADRGREAAF